MALSHYGKHLYMFRNLQTNQVLYTFRDTLKDADLKQIPFIGKHSKPPTIRPDLWKPMCTVTFPSASQGQHAYKILREMRYLHEVSWDKHNPEWIKQSRPERIKLIMNQRANSVADLAKVLEMQAELGKKEKEEPNDEQKAEIDQVLKKKWAKVEKLGKRVEAGEITRIESELKRLAEGFARKRMKERTRISKAIANLRRRREKLRVVEREIMAYAQYKGAITKKRKKAAALEGSELLANPVVHKYLPRHLRKFHREPFTLEGTLIQWADIQDAYSAKEWPDAIQQDIMGPVKRQPLSPHLPSHQFPMTKHEYKQWLEASRREKEEAESRSREEMKPKPGAVQGFFQRFWGRLRGRPEETASSANA